MPWPEGDRVCASRLHAHIAGGSADAHTVRSNAAGAGALASREVRSVGRLSSNS